LSLQNEPIFVEGESLEALIVNGLPFERMVKYARQIAAEVGRAHRQGIVHGNLKSSNVLITSDDRVKIQNFGSGPNPALANGAGDESLLYAAPEYLRGEAAAPTGDVWALGVLFWEMSSGEFPFTGTSAKDIRSAIVYSPLNSPPLSWTDEFLAVAFKCLSRSPEGRYRDGAALAAALKAVPLTAWEHAWSRMRPFVIGAVALAAGVAVAVPAYRHFVGRRDDTPRPVSAEATISTPAPLRTTALAVLPFQPMDLSTRDVALEFGLADALIASVSQMPGVAVRPSSAVLRYAHRPADVGAAGRDLRVDTVLDGALQNVRGKVRVTARLFSVVDGRTIWNETFVADTTGLVGIRDAITTRIAQAIAPEIAPQVADEQQRRTLPNLNAYRAYLDGRYFWHQNTEPGVRQALAQFERALAIDSAFAPAHAGIAEGHALLGIWGVGPVARTTERARASALQAVLADDAWPGAHTSLALVKWAYDWNWEQSETEFKRALELNPNDVTAHRWYAYVLASRGRFAEAIAQIQQAREVDPLSLSLRTDLAEINVWSRQPDAAVKELREVLELDPNLARAHTLLGLTYVLQGHVAEGINALERARQVDDSPRVLSSLAYAYGVGGSRARAESLLAELTSLAKRRHVSPFAFSLIHVGLNDHAQALTWLERALVERSDAMATINVYPWLDPLRSDERFRTLLTRLESNRFH
jgi:eukaryotic-like serine/threonine-protein kinase